MQVILKEDVRGQGKKGELIKVSDGYARNFLLPRGLAMEANANNMNELKQREAAAAHKLAETREKARAVREQLKTVAVKVVAKGGSNGKLFGSVTSKEIAEALKKQFDIDIDKRMIVLDEPLRQYGVYELKVKIFEDISSNMKVELVQES